ncbi:MAG: c-type cytochrome, partial [Caulobacteraceae bacterium]
SWAYAPARAAPLPTALPAGAHPSAPQSCVACHLSSGEGLAGVPNLAGLSADYIAEQVHEFRDGRRLSSQPGRLATAIMIEAARKVSDPDLARAAAYFAALPRRPWVRVVETATVLGVRPEPLGNRIVEVPEHMAGSGNPGVVAYVPLGAVARGEALVRTGGHGSEPCASCHAADLRGLGDTPPLAGRSPSYLARMLWDLKTGARHGPAVAQMQGPAAALNDTDITDVAAYLASLKP